MPNINRTPPPEGDGKTELSRCNNDERKWLAATASRAQVLAMKAKGLGMNEVATRKQVEELQEEIEGLRTSASTDWAAVANNMRVKAREEALAQATTKWAGVVRILTEAAADTEAKKQRLGTGTRAKEGDATKQQHQQQQQQQQMMQQALKEAFDKQMQEQVKKIREEFVEREKRIKDDYEARLATEDDRRRREEEDRTVRYTDEIRKMERDLAKRREEDDKREREHAEEMKRLQQQLREMNNTGGRHSEEYWWDYHPYTHRTGESARDRLHREPSPLLLRRNRERERRTDGSSNEANQNNSENTKNAHTGETHRPSAGNGVLARFGTYAGQVHMPVTDPFRTTMDDEDASYYEQNFPPPFNQPPPADARKITEFRKMEGLIYKFSGVEEEFHGWISLFVPNIHRASCPVAWKATILHKCLDTNNQTLRNIVATGGATKEDYANSIHKLMRAFAHPQGMVAAKLRALEAVGMVTEGDHYAAEEWLIKLEAYLTAARARGMQADIFSVQLYEDNLARMDDTMAHSYLNWASLKDLPNNAVTICAWLEEKIEHAKQLRRRRLITESRATLANRYRARSSPPGKRSPRGERPSYGHQATTRRDGARRRYQCPIDGENHTLENCDKFKALRPNERRQKLREWQRCYACFSLGHNISGCTKNIRCNECTHYHHTLLHGSSSNRRGTRRATDSKAMTTVTQEASGGEEDETESNWSEASDLDQELEDRAYKTKSSRSKVVLQTIPIDVYNGKKKISLNCLIDQGATGAFMSRRAAEELEATGYTAESRVTGFDGVVTRSTVLITNLQVSALGHRKRHWIQVQVTRDPAGSYTPHDWTKNQADYTHIKSLPLLPPIKGRNVDLMLGMDTPDLIKSLVPDIGGYQGQPLARFTKLGWIVSGPTEGTGDEECRANFAFKAHGWRLDKPMWSTYTLKASIPDAREPPFTGKKAEEDVRQLLMRMWEIDVAPRDKVPNMQEEKLFKYLRQNLEKDETGKYNLPTLWKTGHPHINNNFRYAEARLKSVLNSKQLRDQRVRGEYELQIQDWRDKKYTELVETTQPEADRAYYLPHFAVVRWEKTTTKVRIVMDGAAKPSKTGLQKCLNDCLLKGPKLVNDLPVVLMRFRLRKVTLAADIKKMFFQIRMRKQDRDMHRFLWQDKDGVKIYRWAVHPFGSAASPCVAIFTIKEHARMWRHKYPRAAETVIHSTLVDDNLDSCHTTAEAIELGRQLVALFKEAGMELGKIISNDKAVRSSFPPHMRAESLDIGDFCTEDLDGPVVKTLGVVYLSEEDAFSYQANIPDEKSWTKRKILQHKAKLYDPHGLIAPHTTVAGIILQQLWRQGKNWDEEVTGETMLTWKKWLDASRDLPKLRIPRCLTQHPEEDAEVHIFCDASADAYAAVAYYTSASSSRLIGSKARVAPLKSTSIPRLELMGAELVLELLPWLRDTLEVNKSDYWYWSDSTNVLSWMRTESRTLQEFVANRVSRITDETDLTHWRWTPTNQNPADIPSRGATADKLKSNTLWWTGPEYLRTKKWPQQPRGLQMPEEATRELKKSLAFVTSEQNPSIDIYNSARDKWSHVSTSSWTKTVRSFTWCRRMAARKDARSAPLRTEELQKTENLLVKHMQEAALAASLRAVATGEGLSRHSPLAKLDPFLDEDGALRVGGRLGQFKYLPYEQRHQLIIPKDHPWTEHIIRQVHRQLLHQGPNHVAAVLRQKFWIIRATQKIRTVISQCKECTRQRAQPRPQKMGGAAEDRMPEDRCRPFTYTAVDAAGPYYIREKDAENEEKAYFLLFTCCTVRAVHLEAVFDLTTNSFLAALDRFTARRGKPKQMRSDNGANFVAGYSQLRKLWNKTATDHYRQERPDIEWIFNPPKAPYCGGIYERLIGSAKRALYHVAKSNSAPNRETFITMLTVVEGILNTRPLTTLSPEANDLEPLSPAHFLGTGPYTRLAEPDGGKWDQRTLWKALQWRLDRLWRRFCMEVRSSLQPTPKWRRERPNL